MMAFDKELFDRCTNRIEDAWGFPVIDAVFPPHLLPQGEKNPEKWDPELLPALDELSRYTIGDPTAAFNELAGAFTMRILYTRDTQDASAGVTTGDVKKAVAIFKERLFVKELD